MFLFYIDESGTGLGDKKTSYFVLCAFAIPAQQWRDLDAALTVLKRRLVGWAKPEDFELKGRDLRRGEKFFKNMNWETRAAAFRDVANLIDELPCRLFAVQVDKRDLPEYVASENDLYRLAFWRLLDLLDFELDRLEQPGMLMVDARSDLHSSVQDRRLVDIYRDWAASRSGKTHFVELPWFGFSAFYAGLQFADFVAYLTDFAANEEHHPKRNTALIDAFEKIKARVTIVHIP